MKMDLLTSSENPAVGDLVATNRGYASLALEGFSEDVNEDGFVDPIGQAVPVVQYAAPAYHVAAPAVAEVKAVEVKAAPAVVPAATYAYAAPAAYHVAAPAAYHVAAPAVAEVKAAPVAVPAATYAYAAPAVDVATA